MVADVLALTGPGNLKKNAQKKNSNLSLLKFIAALVTVRHDSNQVAHGPRGNKQARRLAEGGSAHLLELNHRRIVAEDVVAQPSLLPWVWSPASKRAPAVRR